MDSEVKREAEVVRQVRDSDAASGLDLDLDHHAAASEAGDVSPTALPEAPDMLDLLEDTLERETAVTDDAAGEGRDKRRNDAFSIQAKRLSGGKDFWDHFDGMSQTPPPPMFPRGSSSAVSDDSNMESPSVGSSMSTSVAGGGAPVLASASRASTPQPLAMEMTRRINGKRRRDDDLDASSFKRRAVSPGMSLQNSPTLSQSPVQKDPGWWGLSRSSRDLSLASGTGTAHAERGEKSSGGNNTGSKRVGFQGMSDTNDGLMKMSIE